MKTTRERRGVFDICKYNDKDNDNDTHKDNSKYKNRRKLLQRVFLTAPVGRKVGIREIQIQRWRHHAIREIQIQRQGRLGHASVWLITGSLAKPHYSCIQIQILVSFPESLSALVGTL